MEKQRYVAAWRSDDRSLKVLTWIKSNEAQELHDLEFRELVRHEYFAQRRFIRAKNLLSSELVLSMLRKQYEIVADSVHNVIEAQKDYRGRLIQLHGIPGIDGLHARVILAESLFIQLRGKKAFCAYCGLVPKRQKSGMCVPHLSGNGRLNSVFTEIALYRLRQQPARDDWSKVLRKMSRKVAKEVYDVLETWE